MSASILPRLAFVLGVLVGLAAPAAAVEPVDYEQAPHLRSFWPTGVACEVVKSIGSAMFGLAANGDVYFFDPTTAPASPGPILSGTGATDLDVWPDTDTLFLNVPGVGVRVVDVSNPQTPQEVQTISLVAAASGVGEVVDVGEGSIRYVSGGPTILFSFVLDLPNATPLDLRTGLLPAAALGLEGQANHVYAATTSGVVHGAESTPGSYDVTIVDNVSTNDISLSDSGNLLGAAQGTSGSGVFVIDASGVPQRTATISGNSIAIGAGDAKLAVSDGNFTFTYDVTNPNGPVPDSTVRTMDVNDLGICPGDTLKASTLGGVQISTLFSSPVEPLAEYIFALPNHVESDATQPGIVFTANDFVVESFDISDPLNPASLGFFPILNIVDFLVRNGRAYATQTGGGLHVMDVSDPTNIVLIGFLGAITGMMDVTPSGDCGLVGALDTVVIVDLTDENNPMPRGSFTFDGPVIDFLLNDTLAVVYHGTAVTVLDITDKDNPVERDRYEGLGAIIALQRTSADDFLIRQPGEVRRIDPDTGAEVGKVSVPVGDSGVLEGVDEVVLKAPSEIFYLTDDAGTLLVLDWTDAANPRVVGEVSGPQFAPRVLTVTANTLVIMEDVGPGQLSVYPAHGTTVTAAPGVSVLPAPTVLRSIYPNPMGDRTNILMELSFGASGSLDVYDLRGRKVRTLFSGRLTTGSNLLSWDGRDDRGLSVAAGRYLVRAAFGGRSAARPVTVVR